jgi:hypothetical protein
MKRLVILTMALVLGRAAMGEVIPGCVPDQNPTKTPHCVLERTYKLNGTPIFQLHQEPNGTCETNIVAAGTFIQVLNALNDNAKDRLNWSLMCASTVFHADLPYQGVTPNCLITQQGEVFSLYYSLLKEPIAIGSREEIKFLKDKILNTDATLCGQGVWGVIP